MPALNCPSTYSALPATARFWNSRSEVSVKEAPESTTALEDANSSVSPAIVTGPRFTPKMLLAWLPLTAKLPAPGPSMSRLLSMAMAPLVSVMVAPTSAGANLIVSPSLAPAIASRNEPFPLSLAFLTVTTLGCVRSSSTSRRGRNDRRAG